MEQQAKGPAETIVSALTSYTDHMVHNRPGLVVPDARFNIGARWEPVTHKEEGGEKVVYRLVKVGKKTQRQRAGVMGADKMVREGGRVVGRYQPAGIFPEVAQWMYQQVADVWKLDNEFSARWASFAFKQDHRDLKVVLAAFMLVQSRKGDPVKDGDKVAFHDADYRDVGEAMALIFGKGVKGLDPKMLVRIHDLLSLPGIAELNRTLGFGRSPREPFLGRWTKAVQKWLLYREQNEALLKGLVKAGFRSTVIQLACMVGYKPAAPKFFEVLRWKQQQAKDGRRGLAIGAEVAAAETWEGLTEKEICQRIVQEKPSFKLLTGKVPAKVGITRAIMAAAIEAGSLSDKDIVIATPTLEELGLLQVQDIKARWEKAIKAQEDMRAANIARNVQSKEVKEALQEGADKALQKAVEEVMKDMEVFVVVDISGSMHQSIPTAKRYLARFLQAFPLEKLHVSVFNTTAREVKIGHASAAGVDNAFLGIAAGGGTDYGAGVKVLIRHMLKPDVDYFWIFVGDEGQPRGFEEAFKNCRYKPVSFGLLKLPGDAGSAVSGTARALGIPCARIDEKIFEDPYAIPRTLRALMTATPVGQIAEPVRVPRVTLVDQILQTDLLTKPAWAA